MLGYFLAGFAGFLFGVIITCILLAQKKKEKYKQIENQVSNNVQDSLNGAKAMYKGMVAAYENGTDEDEDEKDSDDEE